jgi:hypothetical protein
VLFSSPQAAAEPGQAIRLGGVEAQGPATRAVTALHHNPAMLGALRGSAFSFSGKAGLEQMRQRRYLIDGETGSPTDSLGTPTSLLNPSLGYFLGASFYFDPIAFGVGLYDLSSQWRLVSSDPLRFHLAPDPDAGCLDPTLAKCPPNGGALRLRQDLTLALAFNRSNVQFGAAVHFPRMRERFAFDNDTELTPAPADVITARCDNKEDPTCAERVGFKGWTRWIPQGDSPPGFDAALTFGFAFQLRRETISLGARYRTFPLRRTGEVVLDGVALVCRPEGASEGMDVVPPCETARPVRATMRTRLPQEVAFGGSFLIGRARLWRLDTNFYWMDLCPGGGLPSKCRGRDAPRLRLVGLEQQSFVLPEFETYRAAQDLFGIDAHATYRIRSNLAILFGSNFNSPSVARGAQNAGFGDGWRVGLSAGARFRLGQSNVLLTPGYGIDMMLPRHVAPGDARFDPAAANDFAGAGGDINAEGAAAVLQGRARPTNAGRYFGLVHTLALTLSWGESPQVLE